MTRPARIMEGLQLDRINLRAESVTIAERETVNTGSVQDAILSEQEQVVPQQNAGLLIEDATLRRLIEGIALNLDLTPLILTEESLVTNGLFNYELLIADREVAHRIRPLITAEQHTAQEIKPALIALVPSTYPASLNESDSSDFDAVLAVPERPALLSAQLGVALYAHRAFAQRYQSAMEELNLNRNIFKSVTNGISVANAQLPDMPLMYVNPAFEIMTGYSLEDVEGRNCRFLQGEERNQPGITLLREAIAQERETTAVIRNFRKDGSSFWNELALSPIRNRDGVLTHFVGIQTDVTERVEFETALRESEKLAAVGRLASAIAHEINNPLEAVMNLLYLAQTSLPESEATAESKHYLAQADTEVQGIKLITARSLRFYKQSTGPEAILCNTMLDSVIDIYRPRFLNFDVKLERRERSTQHIVCLASEIRQVLSNLITNAVDALRGTGGRLLVRTQEATDWRNDRKGVLLTVADTGKGMSGETLSNLYKAFYTTKGVSGTGLGLWVSAEIVQRHHGRLRVRSSEKPGKHGTIFQLFLPFQAIAGNEGTGSHGNNPGNGGVKQ